MTTTSWALITDGTVANVAVAGDPPSTDWLAAMEATYDAVVEVTAATPVPGIGWTYASGTFTPPPAPSAPEPPAEG